MPFLIWIPVAGCPVMTARCVETGEGGRQVVVARFILRKAARKMKPGASRHSPVAQNTGGTMKASSTQPINPATATSFITCGASGSRNTDRCVMAY